MLLYVATTFILITVNPSNLAIDYVSDIKLGCPGFPLSFLVTGNNIGLVELKPEMLRVVCIFIWQ